MSSFYRRAASVLNPVVRLFSPITLACLVSTTILVIISHGAVYAQNTEAVKTILAPTEVESIQELRGLLNTLWVLIASILVVFMNAGFAMLESGLCREKNTVNILAKNLIVFALATLAFWSTGFSFMFGKGVGIVGFGGWFLSSQDPATYQLAPFPVGLPIPVFFLFQVAFAGTAATIVSGAVAERIRFIDFLIFSLLLVGIAYPITGHWAWSADGWLKVMGFKDFAGSTVVHVVGGTAGLVGAWILGPRLGKYSQGRITALPGHNMSTATLGCLILWIGWFGFNPGSELALNAQVPYIAVTTNLAAAAGGVTATITSWIKHDKPDLSMIINGILAGLVAITAGCNGVSYNGSIIIGAIAGILVVNAITFFDKVGIDDPVGALSVHFVNGIWGTLAVGFFDREVGLFSGFGFNQLFIQTSGILAICGFALLFSFVVWTMLKITLGVRVSPEEESIGLDLGEHAMQAYSGFVKEAEM